MPSGIGNLEVNMRLITSDIIAQSYDWDTYYTHCKVHVSDSRANAAEFIDQTLARLQIDSKLYNLMGTIYMPWIWIAMINPRTVGHHLLPAVLHAVSSCAETIDLRILPVEGSEMVICANSVDLNEIGIWSSFPVGYSEDGRGAESLQEELIIHVKQWKERSAQQ